jgi:putative acetyltransferase
MTIGSLRLIRIRDENTHRYIANVRALFQEYADSLEFDLGFQNFRQELEELPGEYVLPEGRLILALYENRPAGCIALRPLEAGVCELKRLYVRPAFRGRGIGFALSEMLIREAIETGYRRMRLDSIDTMTSALSLYRRFGFREIPPYRYNPIPGALYFELDLIGYAAAEGLPGSEPPAVGPAGP